MALKTQKKILLALIIFGMIHIKYGMPPLHYNNSSKISEKEEHIILVKFFSCYTKKPSDVSDSPVIENMERFR